LSDLRRVLDRPADDRPVFKESSVYFPAKLPGHEKHAW
jgi:hypothetical protein